MLIVRITGICCHIDPRGPGDRFGKRVIIGREAHHHGNGNHVTPHVPYLEIEAEDIASAPPLAAHEHTYIRDNVEYRKFVLDGEEIIIDPIQDDPLKILDTFRELIPSIRKVSGVTADPRPECFAPTAAVVAGYFDINAGILLAGEREQLVTRFRPAPPSQWPDQRNAYNSHLLLRLKPNEPAVITLRSIATGTVRKITLKLDSREITIGNQPIEDIEGRPRVGNESAGVHFKMYYDLGNIANSATLPAPEEVSTAINGCVPTNWP